MSGMEELLALMRTLRGPKGCPWDREQSFATIAPYTIEEAYEVADAIAQKDRAALMEELGDLLFQIVFHAQMAEEEGAFGFDDVVRTLIAKMKRRHPHVFGDADVPDAAAQTQAWETHKAAERAAKAAKTGAASILDGVPLALPALTRAVKLQKRMQRAGFDWPDIGGVLAKLGEELGELQAELEAPHLSHERITDEFGDLLFVCANLGRFLDADPEAALRGANAKVERRFRAIEAKLAARGLTPEQAGLAEMDRLWDEVKAEEKR
jgi:MazG family protein